MPLAKKMGEVSEENLERKVLRYISIRWFLLFEAQIQAYKKLKATL